MFAAVCWEPNVECFCNDGLREYLGSLTTKIALFSFVHVGNTNIWPRRNLFFTYPSLQMSFLSLRLVSSEPSRFYPRSILSQISLQLPLLWNHPSLWSRSRIDETTMTGTRPVLNTKLTNWNAECQGFARISHVLLWHQSGSISRCWPHVTCANFEMSQELVCCECLHSLSAVCAHPIVYLLRKGSTTVASCLAVWPYLRHSVRVALLTHSWTW